MARIIPNPDGNKKNASKKPGWLDVSELQKAGSSELEARKRINPLKSNTLRDVILTYRCASCIKTFSASNLQRESGLLNILSN